MLWFDFFFVLMVSGFIHGCFLLVHIYKFNRFETGYNKESDG